MAKRAILTDKRQPFLCYASSEGLTRLQIWGKTAVALPVASLLLKSRLIQV
ncbi:MAG: hypothetical protein IAF02_12720 [Anaerolineae bacterium]|nr:hypothetical protein [Anaerolineae bacterium]